ncbi:MAG TPA: hypothetical protein VEC01_05150 [Noviherbaspirillum sp.]|uniref:hypothetical protein n=1 Tax=Noviherbaspirillum sp. TaxID=1926288 RepID=UPI002D48D4F5|nr:hypothetical protein [Noviherbaspirillum sp.]HYD94692.1 hypothetical protein [Noviherbaspirillum sp.]
MSNKPSLLGPATVLCLVLGLAGCSGGDGGMESGSVMTDTNTTASTNNNNTNTTANATGNGQQPPTTADAFIARVLAVINSTSETAEPVEVESITVTSPEDVEPVPVS